MYDRPIEMMTDESAKEVRWPAELARKEHRAGQQLYLNRKEREGSLELTLSKKQCLHQNFPFTLPSRPGKFMWWNEISSKEGASWIPGDLIST